MMLQVVENLQEKVQTRDLLSIHSEDLVFAASLQALLAQASRLDPPARAPYRIAATNLAQRLADLHLAGDTQQQALSERRLGEVRAAFQQIKNYFSPEILAAAQSAASIYRCASHRDVVGKRGDHCPKCGAPLDQQARVLPAFCGLLLPENQTIRAKVSTDKPVLAGQSVTGTLHLTKADGAPLYASELIVNHTERLHLFIIDSELKDYHHEHPRPTPIGGQYTFPFTPAKPGDYLVWADIRAQPLGLQHYLRTTIEASSDHEGVIERTIATNVVVDGVIFDLTFPYGSPKLDRPSLARLRITSTNGTPVTRLEPVMDAFAHLVGFYEDRQNILHIHPKGAAVSDPEARGGPELSFQFFPMKAGYVRLFAQIRIDGQAKIAPFGIVIGR